MSYKSLNLILLRRDEQISGYSAALPLSSVYSRFSLNESYSLWITQREDGQDASSEVWSTNLTKL